MVVRVATAARSKLQKTFGDKTGTGAKTTTDPRAGRRRVMSVRHPHIALLFHLLAYPYKEPATFVSVENAPTTLI